MNKHQEGKMNIFPIILIVLLIVGAGYLLTKGDIKIPGLKEEGTVEVRRLDGFPTVINTTKTVDKQRVVVKNQDDLNNFLQNVDDSGLLNLKENIDFNREYLIAVSSKTFDNTGHTFRIKKVYEDKKNNSLLVSIKQTDPGDACKVESQNNIAADIVAISKTDKKIDFEVLKETEFCKTND